MLTLAGGMQAQTYKYNKVKEVVLRTGVELSFDADLEDSARVVLGSEGDTLGVKVYMEGDTVSVDYLWSQIARVEFYEVPVEDNNVNRNSLEKNKEGWRLEFPHFYEGEDVTFEITHSTADYGITYSLEWDGTKKANRWTCYELYAGNMEKNVTRQDAFKQDPDLPSAYSTTLGQYSGSGYSRGHLCPSADRLCSREQNSQTFYLSNMQPQLQAHNGGVWNKLEDLVRNTWAPECDTLYVVKGATIDDDHIKEYTSSGLLVPAVFYMALLQYTKGTNTHKAFGVWSVHDATSEAEYISIDELERRTGIDFFCNLPDDIEVEVEK